MAVAAGLNGAELLDVVDAAAGTDTAARASIMLSAAAPHLRAGDRARLSQGRRDAWLLRLRCDTFGDTFVARARCPQCATLLTVRIPRRHVALQAADEPVGDVVVRRGAIGVRAHAPDGAALASAASCRDVAAARLSLIGSCVDAAWDDDGPLDPSMLDDELVAAVGEAIAAAEPQIEVRVSMACALCAREWAPVLDIVHFLWRELSRTASILLDDVHVLAAGYGWSEPQVLELSDERRRSYVRRLLGE